MNAKLTEFASPVSRSDCCAARQYNVIPWGAIE
jgi:hypothetical protein